MVTQVGTRLALGLVLTCCFTTIHAADSPPRAAVNAAPNAAVIYWQAFASMPDLSQEQQTLVRTAAESISATFPANLEPIIAQHRIALHELQRARLVTHCDWQLDFEAGPELLLPHLQKARDLNRIALLRAHQRFRAGDIENATADVLAAFKMARDCGASALAVSLLIDVAMEKIATDVLAMHLPRLDREQLDRLLASWSTLPETCDAACVVDGEEQIFCDWLNRRIDAEATQLNDPQAGAKLLIAILEPIGLQLDLNPQVDDAEALRMATFLKSFTVADVRTSLQRLHSDYVELARIADLPFDAQTAPIAAFEMSLSSAKKATTRDEALRYFSNTWLPSMSKLLQREAEREYRRQLLEQAILVQRDGMHGLQPIEGKQVEYRKTTHGFELRYQSGSQPAITITIGHPS